MRVLDIDMDFFQTGIHYSGIDSDLFLKDDKIQVWKHSEISDFLENQCNLNKSKKIKGKIVKHHVEAYDYWQELINSQKINYPFEVTHIDAHSDLAFSPKLSYYKFLKDLDNEAMKQKLIAGEIFNNNKELIDSGNYLLAAVINSWVKRIKYVYHPSLDFIDATIDVIENITPRKLFRFTVCEYIKSQNIYMETISLSDYRNSESFDYATIALSPPFCEKRNVR